jgi:hypothetical protein
MHNLNLTLQSEIASTIASGTKQYIEAIEMTTVCPVLLVKSRIAELEAEEADLGLTTSPADYADPTATRLRDKQAALHASIRLLEPGSSDGAALAMKALAEFISESPEARCYGLPDGTGASLVRYAADLHGGRPGAALGALRALGNLPMELQPKGLTRWLRLAALATPAK